MSTDERKVGSYFKERGKVKQLMTSMLKSKFKWTKEVKKNFEESWSLYWKAYDNHERLCKKERR